MLGTVIPRQVPVGVPTKDNKRPSKDEHKNDLRPPHLGYIFQPNVDIVERQFKAPKPPSADMFRQIGKYATTEYLMPSCISVPEKMARTKGANQGLSFNQSFPIHIVDKNQKGIFDKSVSIGNIGWKPHKPVITSTSSF